MHALFALSFATALDLWRRAGTRLLAVACVLFVLTLRYFSTFGLGYEVVQLKELGVYTTGLFGALACLLFCLPGDEGEGEAEGLLLVQPVAGHALTLGAYLGRLAAVTLIVLTGASGTIAALAWFAQAEPRMFHYRGETTVLAQSLTLMGPMFGQWLTLAVLLALAQPVARARRPLLTAAAIAAIYVAGFAAPLLGVASRLLPDFSRYDQTAELWNPSGGGVGWTWLVLHAACWTSVGLAVDRLQLRLKSAA